MNYNEKYQKWVSKEDLDPALKAELLSMDETQRKMHFIQMLNSEQQG